MNKKKHKDKEIWPDEMECASFMKTGGYRVREIDKKNKKLNGTSLFSLKFFVIIILFYFLRLNEALTINPDNQPGKGGLLDTLANMAGENKTVQKGLEFLNPLADVVSGVTGKSGLLNKFMPGESDSDESTPAPVKKHKEMPVDASSAVGSSSSSNSDSSSDSSDEETPKLKTQVAENTTVQPGDSVSQQDSSDSDSDSETESETSDSVSPEPVKQKKEEQKNRNFEESKPKAPKENNPFSERLERPITDHTNEIFESFKQRNQPREQENKKQPEKLEKTTNDTNETPKPSPPQFKETPDQVELVEKTLEQKPKKEKVNAATEQEVEPTAPKNKQTQPEAKPTSVDSEDIYTAGESSAPSENAFKATLKSNFPEKEVTQNDKGTPSPDDDFELQEIAKVIPSKMDPSITKQLDTAFLRRQKQSQMIGSQIPLATSYEYNRDAQVLEPKFETPKVMGGIIQTLTDKEGKLRRMEKRKLKIQHDLNLFISKESANVVNILNNGEMLKLQKYHPLVYMRLLEVFQTQYSLDILMKKDLQKVNKYNKSWYLNSTPGAKESFVEEIRRYSRDPELYGKFKKPKKIKNSRENIYKKLELFHNDYICQRIVRENQYAEKVLRSMEKQSGLYLAPYYHNVVPGLGNLWLIKNFERYFMESFRAKGTTFGKVSPTVVGRFMLMVENGTVMPSTPSSQVAIHALIIMLSMIIDGIKSPKTFLGKKKFYGMMSLCDSACADKIFDESVKKNDLSSMQVEFLKWVITFHSEDLLLVDTSAQRIILNNMYAITREDIYRTSPKNLQLRIQSEFGKPPRRRQPSLVQLEESKEQYSLLELESELESNREKKLSKENEKMLRDLGEKRRQEYRRMQLEKVLEQQRAEALRQKEQDESEIFKRAMKERENMIRRAHMELTKQKDEKEEGNENTLFAKQEENIKEKETNKPKEKEGEVKDKMFYENVRNKLENLGTTYKIFLNRFMTGYHAPGEEVKENGESVSIVPFHVFLQSNRNSEGYDDQFIYVTETLTELVNLAIKDNNAYYYALNTYLMVRSIYSALQSFESSKTNKVIGSKTLGSLLRWLNTDSNRYVQNLPKKFLPLTSLSLQLVMFFQEVVESYSKKLSGSLRSFFKGLIRYPKGSLKTPRNFARLNSNFDTQVIYQKNRYNASLHALKELVDEYKNTFLSKPSIPSPIIQYVTVFTALWANSDSETFTLSERGNHRARKMFLLSFLSNKKSLSEMATEMILKNCLGLKMLHLGCVTKGKSLKEECKQLSIKIKKKHILNAMRLVESTSLDPVDVIKVASDASRRCVANKTVRGHVGAPVLSYLELSEDGDSDDSELPSLELNEPTSPESKEPPPPEVRESDSEEVGEFGEPKTKKPKKSFTTYVNKVTRLFKKQLTPEEEELMIPHFTDILMLHSELTHRMHCYSTQKDLVKSLLKELKSAKDEPDAKQIITNVFARYRTIEVIQSGMASSVHRLVCPFMMDAQDSLRIPLQANIISYVINKFASKTTADLDYKDMFIRLKGKIDLLVPSYESFNLISDLAGCVFVGTRNYNGVYYSGGYAPFGEVEKPKNILLKPGEGRLVYDGENFVPELTALNDVSDLMSIKHIHERDYDRYVYQVRGDKGPVLISELAFALEHPNFVVRAHVLITAKALLGLGFDMGRIIWCGNRYGWVADFVLHEVVPSSDIPVYNGRYWLLTSQLSVKDVVGGIPVRFVNESVRSVLSPNFNYDEEDVLNTNVNQLNIEFTSGGRKIGEVHSHSGSSDVSSSEDEDDASQLLFNSAGDGTSATPGAVKSVRSATFNPVSGRLTLDLDMPDFLASQ